MAKIFIDYGHFNNDSGAVGNGLREVDLNVSIGKYLAEELKRHGVTIKVGSGGSLTKRVQEANSFGPDYFVSGHINAGGGDGFEVFVSAFGGKAEQLAKKIYDQVVNIDKLNNGRGVKQANFTVIKNTNAPAILYEAAFIDTKDIECIDTETEKKAFGISVAKGILKQLGIAYKEEVTPVAPAQETFYRVIAGSYKDRVNAENKKKELEKQGHDVFLEVYKK